MEILAAMSVLIDKPWLALIPAALLGLLFRVSKSRLVLAGAVAWLAYVVYEYAMKYRMLCSGECNIRIDLLAIYPLLLLLSLAGALAFVFSLRKKKPA
jgi:hypothetical protein